MVAVVVTVYSSQTPVTTRKVCGDTADDGDSHGGGDSDGSGGGRDRYQNDQYSAAAPLMRTEGCVKSHPAECKFHATTLKII